MRTDKRTTPLSGFWDKPRKELLELLQATPAGLPSDEAQRRLRIHGPNSLVKESRFAPLLSLLRVLINRVPEQVWTLFRNRQRDREGESVPEGCSRYRFCRCVQRPAAWR